LAEYLAGQIVLADWRDALPKEPNKLRPAIIVGDSDLFDPDYPNVILVPISEDHEFAIADLALAIDPTPENGCTKLLRSIALRDHKFETARPRHAVPDLAGTA
jgi:mRNA interferase MazF